MPWYYAGPDAQPVGPVSLDELQALRAKGTLLPESYIIEDTGHENAPLVWKRFREVFPPAPSLPPTPLPPPPPPTPLQVTPPAPPVPTLPAAQPHPLFPSAGPVASRPPVFTSPAGPDPYYAVKKTNAWCLWGFGLGLASPFLLLACGMGVISSLIALVLCSIGLIEVQKHRDQSGQGLAIAGLLFSLLTLLITVVVLVTLIPNIKFHGQTTTEQTSNDSQ